MVLILSEKNFTTSCILSGVTSLCSTTEKPRPERKSNLLFTVLSTSSSPESSIENAKKCTFLLAVISLFSCLTVPLQRFLGFLYLDSTSSIVWLIFSKSVYVIIASPRMVSGFLKLILFGTLANTLALLVITSPISPFPLVTAFTSSPSSYVRTTVRPSSFQDITPFRPFSHAARSSTLLVLSRESIGSGCLSLGSSLKTSYPTLEVGLPESTRPVSFSSAANSSYNLSYSKLLIISLSS